MTSNLSTRANPRPFKFWDLREEVLGIFKAKLCEDKAQLHDTLLKFREELLEHCNQNIDCVEEVRKYQYLMEQTG